MGSSGTELAKAYVQIVPSAKGIKGKITEELGGEAQSAGTSSGGKIASAIKSAIAAAGIGMALKSAISEGAALEQSIGGIETLFKGSADTVKQYAENAYKTAGLSANAYMETVTSFSASLISSLSGDTAAAADAANTAITDMSDNANKMGTSMEAIQNAYQGFAKQNYTMLDNLKLGYGGTKTEMERLLADAEKITGIKYDISNLSDVYSAIHVIQTELGITGTTAKEASTTLSGSLASMKGAFTNLLGNLSLGQSIGPSLTALSETVYTFLVGNLIPMIGNIISGIPEALSGVLTMVAQGLNLAADNADIIVQSGMDAISKLIIGIVNAIPYLGEAALNVIASFGDALISADWIGMATNLITNLQTGMDAAAEEIIGTDGSIIASVGAAITDNLPDILGKGVEIITNLANGILQNLPTAISSAGSIMSSLIGFITANLPTICQSGFSLIGNLAQGLINNLPSVLSSIASIIASLLAEIAGNLPELLQSGIELIGEMAQGLINNLPSVLSSIASIIASLLAEIAGNLPELLQSGIELIGEMAAGLIEAIPDVVAKIPDIIKGIVDAFMGFDWLSLGGDIISGIADGLWNAAGKIAEAAKEAAASALNAAKDFLGIKSPSRVFRDKVGKMVSLGMAEGIKNNTWAVSDAVEELNGIADRNIGTRIRSTLDYDLGSIGGTYGTVGTLFDIVDKLSRKSDEQSNVQTVANFYLDKRLFARAIAEPVRSEMDDISKFDEMMKGVFA